MSISNFPSQSRNKGVALIVALILLVALSLLAISSMDTATLDLIMSGNEQYRTRALANAEAGITNALKNGEFDASKKTEFSDPNNLYKYTIEPANSGKVERSSLGNSEGTFGAVHYLITSTGTAERSASSKIIQEIYEVVKNSNELTYDQSVCSTTKDLDSTC
jgi:hypothetical protein